MGAGGGHTGELGLPFGGKWKSWECSEQGVMGVCKMRKSRGTRTPTHTQIMRKKQKDRETEQIQIETQKHEERQTERLRERHRGGEGTIERQQTERRGQTPGLADRLDEPLPL